MGRVKWVTFFLLVLFPGMAFHGCCLAREIRKQRPEYNVVMRTGRRLAQDDFEIDISGLESICRQLPPGSTREELLELAFDTQLRMNQALQALEGGSRSNSVVFLGRDDPAPRTPNTTYITIHPSCKDGSVWFTEALCHNNAQGVGHCAVMTGKGSGAGWVVRRSQGG